jgi:hypothetical protein
MADQLVDVGPQGALTGGPALRIEHTAGGLSSPVTLVLETAHPLRQATERL